MLKGASPLGNMGSDLLQRPDDENSPEFAQYLKQLMAIQVNRAKAGFSAPSSGSADAYLAKLNRIKVERMALRKAGLPEDLVDTSYKDEDYINAIQESAEPLVSNSILTGEAAIASPTRTRSGSKTRPMTDEEISAAKAAEETVAKALARNKLLPPDQQIKAPVLEKPVFKVQEEDLDVINNILLKAAASGNKIAANAVQVTIPTATVSKPQVATQASYSNKLKESRESKAPSQTPQATKPERVEAIAPIQQPKQQPSPMKEQQPIQAQKAAPVSDATEYGRKLKVEELEVAAKALHLLVKHRGGGPFGSGRLVGSEVNALEKNLRSVYSMLENDIVTTKKEAKIIGRETKITAADESEPLPDLKKAAAASQPPQVQARPEKPKVETPIAKAPIVPPKPTIAAPKPTIAAPEPVQAVASTQDLGPVEVPISKGLENFLQSPQYLSIQELNGLRDGLIQCLSMIQMEIMKRPIDAPTNMPMIPQSPPVDNMKVLERVMQTNERASSDETEKDVKIALGLLLKHRGGPGFGHGRLEGRELSLLEEKLRNAAEVLLEEAV